MTANPALAALRRAVTGRIESGDAVAIVEVPAPHVPGSEEDESKGGAS